MPTQSSVVAGLMPIASPSVSGFISAEQYKSKFTHISASGTPQDSYIHLCTLNQYGRILMTIIRGALVQEYNQILRLWINNRSQTGLRIFVQKVSGFGDLNLYARLNSNYSVDIYVKSVTQQYNEVSVLYEYVTPYYLFTPVGRVDDTITENDITLLSIQ